MSKISLLQEIPADLHDELLAFMRRNPNWDGDRVVTLALAQFLLNSDGECNRPAVERIYMEALYPEPQEV